jgi:hypothetical protein
MAPLPHPTLDFWKDLRKVGGMEKGGGIAKMNF